MIVSEHNLYVPIEILPLHRFMSPLKAEDATCHCWRNGWAVSIQALKLMKGLLASFSYCLWRKDIIWGCLCVGGPGPSRGLFCPYGCCIFNSGGNHNLVDVCAHVKYDRENRSSMTEFSVVRAVCVKLDQTQRCYVWSMFCVWIYFPLVFYRLQWVTSHNFSIIVLPFSPVNTVSLLHLHG